jgi:hypothetical protein
MRFQKRSSVLLISLLTVFPVQRALNCVEYPMDTQIRVMHFFRDIFEFNDLHPFIYTDHYTYDSPFLQKQLSEADRLNIRDWKLKLNDKEITEKDIISFLYELDPPTYWKHQAEWDLSNRFLNAAKTKHPEIYTYLQLLKELEMVIGNASANSWEYRDVRYSHYGKVIPQAEELMIRTDDVFLKRRYAYKLISLKFYQFNALQGKSDSLLKQELSELFDTYFEKMEKDWMYYLALHYYAQVPQRPGQAACFIHVWS